MGADLAPLVRAERIGLRGIQGRVLAVDALNAVYQFLALVRDERGELLRNRRGQPTSHLVGLLTRYSRLALEYRARFIFVFDGPPHPLKRAELERRREARERALQEYRRLLEAGEYEKAFSKAVVSASVDAWIVESSKRLVRLMGFPVVEAVHDAEAQAAYIVARGEAWAVSSQDYDSLLYGSPRLVRYVTLTGFEWLPSKQEARRLEPELIELERVLGSLGITRRQLVELAVLVGTDFNEGVRGVGPRRALKLIKRYGSLDKLPEGLRRQLPENYREVVELYMNPPVNESYQLEFSEPDEEGLYRFLVEENDFSPSRVQLAVERLRRAWRGHAAHQRELGDFLS
ncbi:MAG: flap endonuclease-1 [Thermofilum sp.]|nr:flap endonuclease-1 [Thermofilum sp.]